MARTREEGPMTASSAPGATSTDKGPFLAELNHLSVPVKDLKQSIRFYMEVLGGEFMFEIPGFAEVRCGGMIVGLAQQPGGWTGHDAEFPHYGWLINAE